jgi:hypothetical protein
MRNGGMKFHKYQVVMPGGELSIVVSPDYNITMVGPAAKIADGTIVAELLEIVAGDAEPH